VLERLVSDRAVGRTDDERVWLPVRVELGLRDAAQLRAAQQPVTSRSVV
jgi:hypothetical protein